MCCFAFIHSYEKAKEAMFYSYNKHINGFAAILEDEEAEEIKSEQKSSACVNSFVIDVCSSLCTGHNIKMMFGMVQKIRRW